MNNNCNKKIYILFIIKIFMVNKKHREELTVIMRTVKEMKK